MFRRLPQQGATPRDVSEIVNGVLNGKTNNTGLVTFNTGGANTTNIVDERISPDSKIILIPYSSEAYSGVLPYGSFFSTLSQTAAAINTAYPVQFNNTEFSHSVFLSNDSRINVLNDGIYNFQFSIQLTSSSNSFEYANIWFRKNGSNVADSNSRIGLPPRKGAGDPSHTLGSMNLFIELEANDYIEIVSSVSHTGVSLETFAATAIAPRTPAIILTVDYINAKNATGVYVSSQSFGTATIQHFANSISNKVYAYIIVG